MTATQLYRIAQEAVTNALEARPGQHIQISLEADDHPSPRASGTMGSGSSEPQAGVQGDGSADHALPGGAHQRDVGSSPRRRAAERGDLHPPQGRPCRRETEQEPPAGRQGADRGRPSGRARRADHSHLASARPGGVRRGGRRRRGPPARRRRPARRGRHRHLAEDRQRHRPDQADQGAGRSVRMLVWSMYNEDLYAERALRAAALGYINKEQATDKIIEAIRPCSTARFI